MKHRSSVVFILVLLLLTVSGPRSLIAADGGEAAELQQIKHEIATIKADEERERQQHEKLIDQLERKVDQLQSEDAQLRRANAQLQSSGQKVQAETNQRLQQVEQEVAAGPSSEQFGRAFQDYLGEHQFTLAGGVGGSFIYDRQTATNTFALDFEPIVLYHVNDWLLFEGTVEANLPAGSDAEFQLPVATAQIFLNDYMVLQAGIFDQPFGDWYEDQSPFWVNRFVTAPLPYGTQALVPPTDIGVQLRGGAQWGTLGQDFDYTVWVANGPGFDTSLPQPVVGEAVNPVNNIALNTNTKAVGARLRFYPLPLESSMGRLEVGASTLDGKWLNGNWYNAWGVDFAYLRGDLQARGEFLEMYRQMPSASADNRQGWYVQIGYFLNDLPMAFLPVRAQNFVQKLEPLIRYSGVNQRAVVADEISTDPETGFSGSPSLFTPHSREVALGLDYWFAPSIVWQNEVDFELPQRGGSVISFDGNPTPTTTPQGGTPNDVAVFSQLAIGF